MRKVVDPVAVMKALNSPGGLMAAAEEMVKYNPEQPRDQGGRFTSGNKSPKGETAAKEPQKKDLAEHLAAVQQHTSLIAQIVENIQRIPAAVVGTVQHTSHLIDQAKRIHERYQELKDKRSKREKDKSRRERARHAGVILDMGTGGAAASKERTEGVRGENESARDFIERLKREREERRRKHRK